MSESTPATAASPPSKQVNWKNVITVVSAGILIGAEVFGAAFAGGWAIAILFNLGDYGVYLLQAIFFVAGIFAMVGFMRKAARVEPFTKRG